MCDLKGHVTSKSKISKFVILHAVRVQNHLKIGIIYILISKDLQSFMKFCPLVFELSRSQVICGGGGCGGATRPKPIYSQTASGDIINVTNLTFFAIDVV